MYYVRNTALRMFAIQVSKYNMIMDKLRLATTTSLRPRGGEASTRRESVLFRRHLAVSQHILVMPISQQDQHHKDNDLCNDNDLVVQDIELDPIGTHCCI